MTKTNKGLALPWRGGTFFIFGYFIQRLSLCINLDKNRVGLHFGRIFHKLIWSPCPEAFFDMWVDWFDGVKNYF
jgi:hypothetical protein